MLLRSVEWGLPAKVLSVPLSLQPGIPCLALAWLSILPVS